MRTFARTAVPWALMVGFLAAGTLTPGIAHALALDELVVQPGFTKDNPNVPGIDFTSGIGAKAKVTFNFSWTEGGATDTGTLTAKVENIGADGSSITSFGIALDENIFTKVVSRSFDGTDCAGGAGVCDMDPIDSGAVFGFDQVDPPQFPKEFDIGFGVGGKESGQPKKGIEALGMATSESAMFSWDLEGNFDGLTDGGLFSQIAHLAADDIRGIVILPDGGGSFRTFWFARFQALPGGLSDVVGGSIPDLPVTVSEPAALGLFGVGLFGLGVLARRRRHD